MSQQHVNDDAMSSREGSPASAASVSYHDFRAAVRRHIKRAHKRQEKLNADCAACQEAPCLLRDAELLKASMDQLKRGMDSVTVHDYFSTEPNAMRTIALDPARPPREQMQKLFKKAAKLERCREQAMTYAAVNEKRIMALEALLAQFDAWKKSALPDEALPEAYCVEAARLEIDWHPGEGTPQGGATPAAPEKAKGRREREQEKLLAAVRTFTSHDGMEILVGKTAQDNDTLSFRIARGNDWWFHLGAAPGSHVVVRSAGGKPLPQETLLDAAHLCVYFSKMRTTDRADVTYTQARWVRRIKGAPPGKVQVERSQSLYIRMEQSRLNRLLGNHRA